MPDNLRGVNRAVTPLNHSQICQICVINSVLSGGLAAKRAKMNDSSNSHAVSAQTGAYVDLNLMVLLRYLVQSWRFILICVVVMMVMTTCSLRNASAVYEATMVVAPTEDDSGGGGGSQSLTSKVLSSLTSGGSAAGGQHFDEFQYLLTAPSTIHAANADGKLFTWLYGGQWNEKTRTFIKPNDMNQQVRAAIRRFFRRPEWYAQDDILTSQLLSVQIMISPMPKSSLTTLSYQNSDPKIAVAVLSRLFSVADRVMRDKQRARLKAQIANANDMLAETQVSDLRQAMAQQIANSQYRLMNVPESIDYAAKSLEPAYVSPVPIAPKPAKALTFTAIVTLLLSAFVGVGYRIIRAQFDARGLPIPVWDEILARVADLRRRFLR